MTKQKKVLLLNNTYDVLQFVSERKALRLFIKQKVDVVCSWMDETLSIFGQVINLPAIIKMRYYINRKFKPLLFSRKAVLKRDKYQCLFCGKFMKPNQATVDHIVPRSKGGENSFTNCATSCHPCNAKKGNRPLEETNLKLIKMPSVPDRFIHYLSPDDQWHEDWVKFLGLTLMNA